MKTRKAKRSYWSAHIKAWNSSGLSQAEYCRVYHLRSNSFTYWKRRFKEIASPHGLIPVQVLQETQPPELSSTHLTIRVGNTLSIEVPDGFDASTLARVMEVLRGTPCC